MARITRIAYSNADWHHPTGEAAQYEGKESYANRNRFGHEDWLFRDEWEVDGWRYAFLQGVNRSYRKLVGERKPFDVTLYTIQPDKQRRYVARIQDVECLDDEQAEKALDLFKANGWFRTMQDELREIGANIEALGHAQWVKHVLNVRFRLENVHRFAPDTFASRDDPVWRLNRYSLTDVDGLRSKFRGRGGRSGSTDFPSIAEYTRRGNGGPIRVTPEHARMQAVLMEQLQIEFPGTAIVREENFVDVLVKTSGELRLYEIKSDLAPRTVIRLAIGQLLEYSYFHIDSEGRKVTLVAVGRKPLSSDDAAYLAHLRGTVGLPLEYRFVKV